MKKSDKYFLTALGLLGINSIVGMTIFFTLKDMTTLTIMNYITFFIVVTLFLLGRRELKKGGNKNG